MNRPTISRIVSTVAALAVVVGGAGLTASSAFAAEKDKDKKAAPTGPQLSKKVLPPLKAAGDAFNAKQYDVALAKTEEANAVEGKTPYDQFRIDELFALIYMSNTPPKFPEALAIYEKHQATPEFIEPQLLEIRPKIMVQLAFRAQAHDKVVQHAKTWLEKHPDDTQIMDLAARSSYIGKDYKTARGFVLSAIEANEKAGKAPEELWLQLASSTAQNMDDQAGTMTGYEKLVRYYPKPEHWSKALESALAVEKNDAAIIQILRLMADVDVLKRADYYMEYAQRAQDEALPGEALKVLETGFEKKVLGATDKEKQVQQNALNTAKEKARIDKAQLPEIEKETKASKVQTGQPQAGLGLAYFSNQMYEQAIPMLEAGLAKNGIKQPERYRMALAISYYRLGQKEKAREEFQKVGATAAYARVAGFWAARTYN